MGDLHSCRLSRISLADFGLNIVQVLSLRIRLPYLNECFVFNGAVVDNRKVLLHEDITLLSGDFYDEDECKADYWHFAAGELTVL